MIGPTDPLATTATGHGHPTWVLLHGFMGDHADYDPLRGVLPGRVLTPDLPGHGASRLSNQAPASWFDLDHSAHQLAQTIQAQTTEPVILWGYSMGGRLALGFAIRYPTLVRHLIIESATAGLADPVARQARQQADARLAERLRTQPLMTFLNDWDALPLFASQRQLPATTRQQIRRRRQQLDPQQLALSLTGFGTGTMPNLWPQLSQLTMPTTVITGALDPKFTALGHRLSICLPHATHHVIPKAGHNCHLEQPTTVLTTLSEEGVT